MPFKKGNKPWNTGKKIKPHTKEWKTYISKIRKENPLRHAFIKGHIPWNKGLKGFRAGKLSTHWKGGITEENEKIRHSIEYFSWRNEVYKRDHYTCRICKKHCQKKDIVAHHIKLFADFPELRFSVDNGITLCRSCHRKIHNNKSYAKI